MEHHQALEFNPENVSKRGSGHFPRCARQNCLTLGVHSTPASIAGRVRIGPLLRQSDSAHLLLRLERQPRWRSFYTNGHETDKASSPFPLYRERQRPLSFITWVGKPAAGF